jgi:hypothetical protein
MRRGGGGFIGVTKKTGKQWRNNDERLGNGEENSVA